MVELKLVWWPQFPTEEFEYHYLPLTATVGTPRFEYEEAPYFQRLLLHANAAQVTRKKAVISCLAAAMVHGIPVLNLERSTRVELNPLDTRRFFTTATPTCRNLTLRWCGGIG